MLKKTKLSIMRLSFFIFALLSIPLQAFSQDEMIVYDVIQTFPAFTDSLLHKEILDYAQEKCYIDKEDVQNGGYDSVEIYQLGSIVDEQTSLDICLFTVPSFQSHPDWGIAIKTNEKTSLYRFTWDFAPAVAELCNMAKKKNKLEFTSFILSTIYNVASCISPVLFEMKQEEREDAIYYYHIYNWAHIFKKHEIDYIGRRMPAHSNTDYALIDLLKMGSLPTNPRLDKPVKTWIRTTYKVNLPYKIYQIETSSRSRTLYLLEVKHSKCKTYELLFKEDNQCLFYQLENLYVPLLHQLKNYIKDKNTLLEAIEIVSTFYMYYSR